jgi:hypothetical protein
MYTSFQAHRPPQGIIHHLGAQYWYPVLIINYQYWLLSINGIQTEDTIVCRWSKSLRCGTWLWRLTITLQSVIMNMASSLQVTPCPDIGVTVLVLGGTARDLFLAVSLCMLWVND